MKYLFFLVVLILLGGCDAIRKSMVYEEQKEKLYELDNFTQDGSKCYAEVTYQRIFGEKYQTFFVSNLPLDLTLGSVSIVEKSDGPATTKWVKKKADKNCLSADPDDCLVWCLVEVPSISASHIILNDTTGMQNYKLEKLDVSNWGSEGGFIEKVEIVCPADVTETLLFNLQSELLDQGYYVGEINAKYDAATREAFMDFQQANKKHRTALGVLDVVNLRLLGIKY